jgi:hypothetical protein
MAGSIKPDGAMMAMSLSSVTVSVLVSAGPLRIGNSKHLFPHARLNRWPGV